MASNQGGMDQLDLYYIQNRRILASIGMTRRLLTFTITEVMA